MNNIEFNDEIVEIVEIGERECIDIEVSDNHLFYANDILTKNSAGLSATVDFLAIYGLDEDDVVYAQELHGKIVKSRFGRLETFKFYYDSRTLKLYDESESDLWVSEAQKSGDERNTYERTSGNSSTNNQRNR